MAFNLFTKTYLAYQQATPASANHDAIEEPMFAICEQDESRANAFLDDIREKAGSEISSRIQRVGNGAEYASIIPTWSEVSY
jgi:hypothetical protein